MVSTSSRTASNRPIKTQSDLRLLSGIALGDNITQIAYVLGIDLPVANDMRTRLMRLYGATNPAQLIIRAIATNNLDMAETAQSYTSQSRNAWIADMQRLAENRLTPAQIDFLVQTAIRYNAQLENIWATANRPDIATDILRKFGLLHARLHQPIAHVLALCAAAKVITWEQVESHLAPLTATVTFQTADGLTVAITGPCGQSVTAEVNATTWAGTIEKNLLAGLAPGSPQGGSSRSCGPPCCRADTSSRQHKHDMLQCIGYKDAAGVVKLEPPVF